MDTRSQRKSPRLQGYDYSQAGAYFVTICTHRRQHLFGEVRAGEMMLNASGEIAHDELQKITHYWDFADVDLFVVMPNHIHAIIIIDDTPVGTHHWQLQIRGDTSPASGAESTRVGGLAKSLSRPYHSKSVGTWPAMSAGFIAKSEHSIEVYKLTKSNHHFRTYVL